MAPVSAANSEPAANIHSSQCPTGTLVRWDPAATTLAPAWCKRWRCDNCGWRKAKALAARILLARPSRFITLTVRPTPELSAQEELDRMNVAWRALWKRIKRLFGDRARGYVRIVELTQRGTPHLHLALGCPFLPQSTLSRWWAELSGSPIVDIRAIRTENGLARYLTKYLTKEHGAVEQRRKWSQSRAFLPSAAAAPDEPDVIRPTWVWSPGKLEAFEEALAAAGWVPTMGLWLSPEAATAFGASP